MLHFPHLYIFVHSWCTPALVHRIQAQTCDRVSPVESQVVKRPRTAGHRIARNCWTTRYLNFTFHWELFPVGHSTSNLARLQKRTLALPCVQAIPSRRSPGPLIPCNPQQHAKISTCKINWDPLPLLRGFNLRFGSTRQRNPRYDPSRRPEPG
jgi:hypothetical protein